MKLLKDLLDVNSEFNCAILNKEKILKLLEKYSTKNKTMTCNCGKPGSPSCHCFYDYE